MKSNYIYLIIFILFSINLPAQKIQVLDKSDLQPIGHATLSLDGKVAVTDVSGKADISSFSENDTIVMNHAAFQPVRMTKKDMVKSGVVYMTENVIKLDEFVITANKVEEKKSDLPYKVEVIPSREIAFNNPQTTAHMLERTGDVFVQQSQLGGGSPVLRGFEANKVLLVVDGVRMNNAIYRAGHLQSIITVDPFSLASTEILYGPGSVIYGSDALGGVISFRTKDPVLSSTGKIQVNGNLLGRYASANTEKTGGVNLNLGWNKVAALINFSYSDFDDLREGATHNSAYPDWGKRFYYAERINGKDSMVVNKTPNVQKPSGYSQYNVMGKLLYQPSENSRYLLNVQYSSSSDIPRYDRLTEFSSKKLKYAEWYYGPQKRLFVSLKAGYNLTSRFADHASVILSYQNIHEDRINRSFGKDLKKFNLETAGIMSANIDLDKKITKKDQVRYGIEVNYNDITSEAHRENIITGAILEDLATRYPDDKANMSTLAAYVSNSWKISRIFNFSQGVRLSYVNLTAAYSDTMMRIMKFPFNKDIKQNNTAVNGYAGLVATPGAEWKFALTGSTGFRAPNIDDLTKLSESSSTDKVIIVPNPDLKPEYAYNLEFSAGKTILKKIRLEGSVFYTWLRDALAVSPFTYNGSDSLLYDGVVSRVYASQNAGKAYIYGIQGNMLAQLTPAFSIISNLTFTRGRISEDEKPLDHIPPVYGMTTLQLELKKFKGSVYAIYNGWKHMSDYSQSGEDNETYATVDGTPSWYTLNIKTSYQINRNISADLGLENILDVHYRKFASGVSSPGRNLIIALRGTF